MFAAVLAAIIITGCVSPADATTTDNDAIFLDVRTQEEFNSGHIPGAVLLPLDQIEEIINLIPNLDQPISIYCRSGNRSNTALGILIAMGYTNVTDIGGILDWTGEIVLGAANDED